MKRIFIFGAGKSAFYTISYLANRVSEGQLELTVADASSDNVQHCKALFPQIEVLELDVNDASRRRKVVKSHDVVVSLLPASFHLILAKDCLELGKNLITPSYVTLELLALNNEVKAKGLLFINELGLDPGIDHISAMEIIHRLQDQGAEITSFKSWCGGLVAPESDDNPWHYKFSWAPANVLRAGYDGAIYLNQSSLHVVPYHNLFQNITDVSIPGNEEGNEQFEGYLNRDSARYITIYGLENTSTFIRGTLRTPGFCNAWNHLVQSGITTDRIYLNTTPYSQWRDFLKVFNFPPTINAHIQETMDWTFADEFLPAHNSIQPVNALQQLLEKKLAMQPEDKDRVVMIHEFEYVINSQKFRLTSWMDLIGRDSVHTAMAKTVGTPLALAAERMIGGEFKSHGVVLPVIPEIYIPLLKSLKEEGIYFNEKIEKIEG